MIPHDPIRVRTPLDVRVEAFLVREREAGARTIADGLGERMPAVQHALARLVRAGLARRVRHDSGASIYAVGPGPSAPPRGRRAEPVRVPGPPALPDVLAHEPWSDIGRRIDAALEEAVATAEGARAGVELVAEFIREQRREARAGGRAA